MLRQFDKNFVNSLKNKNIEFSTPIDKKTGNCLVADINHSMFNN